MARIKITFAKHLGKYLVHSVTKVLTVIIIILRRDARGEWHFYDPGCDSSNFHRGLVPIREAGLGGRKAEEKGGRASVLDELTETPSPILESILPLDSLLWDAVRFLFRMSPVRLSWSWHQGWLPGICPGAPWVVCRPGPTSGLISIMTGWLPEGARFPKFPRFPEIHNLFLIFAVDVFWGHFQICKTLWQGNFSTEHNKLTLTQSPLILNASIALGTGISNTLIKSFH